MRNTLFAAAAAATVAAALLGYLAWRLYRFESALLKRPSVSGTVLSVALSEAAESSVSATASSASHNYRRVVIEYEYMVDGHRFVGHNISNSPPLESVDAHKEPSERMSAYLRQYHSGTSVVVHYAEKSPQTSYLEIDTSGSRRFGAAALAAAVLAVVLVAWALLI